MNMKFKKIILAVLLLSFSVLCAAEGYAVIVNKANAVEKISSRDLKRIFLGEKTTWPHNKEKIRVAVFKKAALHKEFLRDILKKSPLQFSLHWKRILFTGTGSAPNIFNTDAEVKEFVKANPTAIGYISPQSLDDTVKKISTD